MVEIQTESNKGSN
uniref:Uncharacterized protein n=1 Tax=Anguilla anguilla TaxID=7936 RepID=A0A0E9XBQ7_ANGAN